MIYSIMTIYQYSCDFIVEEILIYCVLSNVLDLLIQISRNQCTVYFSLKFEHFTSKLESQPLT